MFNKSRKTLSLSRSDQAEVDAQLQAGRQMAGQEAESAIKAAGGFNRDSSRHLKQVDDDGNQISPDTGESGRARNRENRKPPKGHEIPLASLIKRKSDVVFKTNRGDAFTGQVTGFDNYTITVVIEGQKKRTTFFKSALESFTTVGDQF